MTKGKVANNVKYCKESPKDIKIPPPPGCALALAKGNL